MATIPSTTASAEPDQDLSVLPALERRVSLAHLPTPLEPMDRLGAHLGMQPGRLWVKRDDCTGLATGGNKTRKLEYLCAQAVQDGADMLVTGAGVQSNHCRQTAAAANRLGLDCVLLLDGDKPDEATGNVLLFEVMGAHVEWLDPGVEDLDAAIAARCDELAAAGRRPAFVPVGGSNGVGGLGYVRAAHEIQAQLPDVQLVVTGTGSAGTHAGLVVGFGDHERVLGVRVGERRNPEERVEAVAREVAAAAGVAAPTGTCQIEHDYLGEGYGAVTPEAMEAIHLAGQLEGLVLDPCYTGKAMSGLIGAVRSGRIAPDCTTVFVHTGGAPGLFSDRYRDRFDVPNGRPRS